jgi:hypothetical protein
MFYSGSHKQPKGTPPRRTSNCYSFNQNFPRCQVVHHGDVQFQEIAFDIERSVNAICIPRRTTHLPPFSGSCIATVAYEYDCEVTQIPDKCFFECKFLVLIWIPRQVTTLGDSCFHHCTNLVAVLFAQHSEVWEFGKDVFDATSLRTICLPPKLRVVNTSFCNTPFERFDIDPANSVFSYHNDFLRQWIGPCLKLSRYCGRDHNIFIPKEIGILGHYCFKDTKITTITFEDGSTLREILGACFMGTHIAEIEIPRTCRRLGASAFSTKSRIVSQPLPARPLAKITFCAVSELETIAERCFVGCNLEAVVVPRAVRLLDMACFLECRSLRTVEFEAESCLEVMNKDAFRDCCELTGICIPPRVKVLPLSCFQGCTKLAAVAFAPQSALIAIQDSVFLEAGVTEICIPATVERIGASAFGSCFALTKVEYAGGKLPEVATNAFHDCPKLKWPKSENEGVVIEKEQYARQTLQSLPFAISAGIRRFEEQAFFRSKIECEMIVPATVIFIGKSCFEGSQLGAGFAFEEKSGLKDIPIRCFSVASLAKIAIPPTVESIGGMCFSQEGRTSTMPLQEITFAPLCHLREIGMRCFSHCRIASIRIPTTVQSIGEWCFFSCRKLTKLEFATPSELHVIPRSCFQNCGLVVVHFPNSIETIRQYAFCGCSALVEVTFEDKSEYPEIEENAFDESVEVPQTV